MRELAEVDRNVPPDCIMQRGPSDHQGPKQPLAIKRAADLASGAFTPTGFFDDLMLLDLPAAPFQIRHGEQQMFVQDRIVSKLTHCLCFMSCGVRDVSSHG